MALQLFFSCPVDMMRNAPRGDCTYHGHGVGLVHITITLCHGLEVGMALKELKTNFIIV